MSSKLAEALKHVQAAEKCMKTSFTKWKPDPDGAAAEYIKAAVAFKNGKSLPEAKDAYEKAAECQLQCNQLFHSAKSFEQAALIAKDMNDFNEVAKLGERSCNMLMENGTPDSGVLVLLRIAKIIENHLPDSAANMYMKSAHIYDNESNAASAASSMRSASRILIKIKKYDEAVTALQQEINYNAAAENYEIIHRLVVCMILLHLYRGDCVAADKAYKHAYVYAAFDGSDEAGASEALLEAINQGDEAQAGEILNSPIFKYLDNDFARLARDLKDNPPEGMYIATGAGKVASSAGKVDEESEDEYGDGLC